MCHQLDPRFFEELSQKDPGEVCRRALCDYDKDSHSYIIRAWGADHLVKPKDNLITPSLDGSKQVNIEVGLSIIFYLLQCRDLPISGEWVSEKDLPGGVSFFRGPHSIPVHVVTDCFGQDIESFRKACKTMEGQEIPFAEAAYSFKILPRVPVAVLFWPADSEFSAESRVLFDRLASFVSQIA